MFMPFIWEYIDLPWFPYIWSTFATGTTYLFFNMLWVAYTHEKVYEIITWDDWASYASGIGVLLIQCLFGYGIGWYFSRLIVGKRAVKRLITQTLVNNDDNEEFSISSKVCSCNYKKIRKVFNHLNSLDEEDIRSKNKIIYKNSMLYDL